MTGPRPHRPLLAALRALVAALALASGGPAAAQDAGLPETKAALRALDREIGRADAANTPRLRAEADRLERRLDALGPPAGGDRATLNALGRRLDRMEPPDEGAPLLPGPPPQRSRLVTPALPQTDLTLDDLGPAE